MMRAKSWYQVKNVLFCHEKRNVSSWSLLYFADMYVFGSLNILIFRVEEINVRREELVDGQELGSSLSKTLMKFDHVDWNTNLKTRQEKHIKIQYLH